MAKITIAMRHSQGVTMQHIALSIAERAAFTTRLAVASYEDEVEVIKPHEVPLNDALDIHSLMMIFQPTKNVFYECFC